MGWYVLQGRPGQEKVMIQACRRHLSVAAAQNIFILTQERLKKTNGSWEVKTVTLFPGYIFMESQDESRLSDELIPLRNILRVMEERDNLISLSRREEEFFEGLFRGDKCLRMSHGIIENGMTKVTDGPLKGRETMIRRIDRHKRVAVLNATMERQTYPFQAGLEITSKN